MIAGEYAILEPKQHGIVMAVNRYVTAEIKRNKDNIISLPQYGLNEISWRLDGDRIVFNRSDPRLALIKHTIELLEQFFQEQSILSENYTLTINSELADSDGKKYGLGSSAAVVVAAVASILAVHNVPLSKIEIFKLAALIHLKTQGNGSGADIAASTFGGWIDYSAFYSSWVLDRWKERWNISELIKIPWPNLSISPLLPPSDLELCVGWTKVVAKTGPMVEKIQKLRDSEPEKYDHFLRDSSDAVSHIVIGFKTENRETVMHGIFKNRQALRMLGDISQVSIETPQLQKLCDIGEEYGKAKLSGAGGGDCGIAFIQNPLQRSRLHDAWLRKGILPLNLNESKNGLIVSESVIEY